MDKKYDVVIIGAGPGGIFSAYELVKQNDKLKIAIIESGSPLNARVCPAKKNNTNCVKCKTCSIMNGFGGAGAFSDGKYNITNEFGGNLYEYIGKDESIELMEYVDSVNRDFGGNTTKLYEEDNYDLSTKCMQNNLHLLNAKVRHLGTDINYKILENLYSHLRFRVAFYFYTEAEKIAINNNEYVITVNDHSGSQVEFTAKYCIISTGRSSNTWVKQVCRDLNINTSCNKVDIGVRVELPHAIFSSITDEVYEGKIVYSTSKYQDLVRTFCMNPHGEVVTENTNGIITVNGHSYSDPAKFTKNTNFALLVSKHFTEPFNNSGEYGESIARLSNMLGDGVIVQRFGDLIRGKRSNEKRIKESFVTPTLKATPGDLSLVIPKRILDDIVEMIYALDKIAPGTANDDTLLYGVEVKFYNTDVEVDSNLETVCKNLYIIGDGSGITHSLSQASASGVYVARHIIDKLSN